MDRKELKENGGLMLENTVITIRWKISLDNDTGSSDLDITELRRLLNGSYMDFLLNKHELFRATDHI